MEIKAEPMFKRFLEARNLIIPMYGQHQWYSPSEANHVLSQYSKSSHILCNATSLPQLDKYHYTKVCRSNPTLHDVTINNSIIQRIIIAVDKNGLFTGLLNMDLYRTSEKRRINTVAQPNPSEGDMSSFWYWYFRKHKYVSGATVAEGN
jgi:hypothetical protein